MFLKVLLIEWRPVLKITTMVLQQSDLVYKSIILLSLAFKYMLLQTDSYLCVAAKTNLIDKQLSLQQHSHFKTHLWFVAVYKIRCCVQICHSLQSQSKVCFRTVLSFLIAVRQKVLWFLFHCNL